MARCVLTIGRFVSTCGSIDPPFARQVAKEVKNIGLGNPKCCVSYNCFTYSMKLAGSFAADLVLNPLLLPAAHKLDTIRYVVICSRSYPIISIEKQWL